MRKSHEEQRDLISARVTDFINGDASEAVLKASLKALGLDRDEINYEYWKACTMKMRTHGALLTPKEKAHG